MQTEWAIVMHRVPPGDAYAASPNVRFGSKADMCSAKAHVRFVPKADITNLFDHLTGEAKNGGGYFDPKRFCSF